MRCARLLLFAFGLSLAATPVRAQEADAPEPVLVDLQIGRLAIRTVEAYRVADTALVPVAQLFDLAEIGFHRTPAGAYEARLYPGDRHLLIDPLRNEVRLEERSLPLRPDQIVRTDAELYLSTVILARVLDIEFATLWADLKVAVTTADRLPVGRRVAREEMRTALLRRERRIEPDMSVALDRTGVDGLVLDYSVLTPGSDVIGGGAYSAMLGMDLMGGSLELGMTTDGSIRAGRSRSELAWRGVYRNDPRIRQVTVGDGVATGPRPRNVRGFSVTNAPYVRSADWGQFAYDGQLGPGWQVEAYRGGRLIAFDSVNALGRFSLDVPVQYGENPVDFVAYGPFGEMRQFNRTYRVVNDALPVGQFEYGVTAGSCRIACSGTGNLDLRYGVARGWTVRAGMDAFWRDSLANLWHPYAGVTGTLGQAWALQVEGVAGAAVRGGLRYEPSLNLQLSTEYSDYATGTDHPILTAPGRRAQWTLQGLVRPLGIEHGFYLDGSIDRTWAVGGTATSGRLSAALQVAQMRILPSLRVQRTDVAGGSLTQGFYGVNAFALPRPRLGPFLGKVSARTNVEFTGALSPRILSAYLSRAITSGLRVETGLAWTRGQGTRLSVILSTNLPTIRGYTTMTTGGGSASATQFVQGAVLYNRETRDVELSNGPAVDRAGLAGTVFLDANGNGFRDPGEPGLPGVRLKAGISASTTDSTGRYQVWDLVPWEPVLVSVDSLSLRSPLWVPGFATISVEPSPNRYRVLDIPVLPGGVLQGRVLREDIDGARGQGGVTLVIRNSRTGDTRTILTFSDGEFYAIGIKPGDYDISVDESVLERFTLATVPPAFTMPAEVDGATVDGIEIRLSPR